LQELIEDAIVRKARSVLRLQRISAATQRKYAARFTKRTGLSAGASTTADPLHWSFHPHFNPKYCINHARYLSKVIWRKLESEMYEPIPAVQFDIPKPDGSKRQIMAFTIPDSALANVLHKRITQRNINLFSSYSFAYRPDRNVFDAIIHLNRSLQSHKSYIIQYDFSKYFDTISHGYLEKILFQEGKFLLSVAERAAIRAFLKHSYCHILTYKNNIFDVRDRGVPQGSSISLFLSNAAAHDLDLALERQNGTFVRFADDVVAVTHSYSDALNVAAQFRKHCHDAGLRINFDKSPGIVLFGGGRDLERRQIAIDTDDASVLKTEFFIDYLGHRLSSDGITLPLKSIKRIKRRISEIVYKHLFLHRRGAKGAFDPARIGPGYFDWDLVTCLNEIRSYIYGGLRESHFTAFLDGNVKLPFVRGLMAFFPLTTSVSQLSALDGWLLSIVRLAQRERARMLVAFGHSQARLKKHEVLSGEWYQYPAVRNDMQLPSFVRAWRASRRYYLRFGLSNISAPAYYSLVSYD
jgi:RNA-directed DNA polymerase